MSAPLDAAIPECTHRPTCPGCPRYAEAGIASTALEALAALASECGAALEPSVEGAPLGHRHRARLMLRGRSQSPKVGLFQTGSHKIVDIPHCHVHHPVVNSVAAALKRAMRATESVPYADAPHRGLVRALQVVVERSSGRAQTVVVTNSTTPDATTWMNHQVLTSDQDGMMTFLDGPTGLPTTRFYRAIVP